MTTVESMQAARRDGRQGHWVIEVRRLRRWWYELSEHLIDGPRNPCSNFHYAMTRHTAEAKARRWLRRLHRRQEAQAIRVAAPLFVVKED